MDGKILVVLEGQQHWVNLEIAQNDDLLRQLFSTLSPALAGADINRTDTRIDLVPKKGTKGINLLTVLDTEPIAIHPGIECCIALQQHELRVGIDAHHADAIATQIERAIAQTKDWKIQMKATLQRLDRASNHSIVPVGF